MDVERLLYVLPKDDSIKMLDRATHESIINNPTQIHDVQHALYEKDIKTGLQAICKSQSPFIFVPYNTVYDLSRDEQKKFRYDPCAQNITVQKTCTYFDSSDLIKQAALNILSSSGCKAEECVIMFIRRGDADQEKGHIPWYPEKVYQHLKTKCNAFASSTILITTNTRDQNEKEAYVDVLKSVGAQKVVDVDDIANKLYPDVDNYFIFETFSHIVKFTRHVYFNRHNKFVCNV